MTLGDSIRKGVGMVHGTGEAIRGNAMSMVDEASGDKASATKNQEIAKKGVDEWDRGYRGHPADAGVTPADADAHRERMNTTGTTATNYGSHNSNIGNKVDPRYDSDLDHRGTATDSTNAGPHSTNVGNKMDPRFDSDVDHRADPTSKVGGTGYETPQKDGTAERDFAGWQPSQGFDDAWHPPHESQHDPNPPHEHRGSIGGSSGLEAANKLDPVFTVGSDEESMKYTDHPNIHRLRGSISGASGLEAAQKLDPPEQATPYMPDEVSARGPGYSQPDPSYHQPKPTHQSSVLNMLDEDVEPEQYPPPNRATTEPAPQYDDGSENSAESGRRKSGSTQFFKRRAEIDNEPSQE
ncbi:uncharacterized protein J4E88_001757 [Alternaria novae-zelandiae]|uniref:uncharacterized protein n=1 Tax=Alternaria novae-zelandiae TaxID=430562 RepID=UPI0020C4DDC2|nr:uncharacterized protein J4E88_001757 [Alternaria novae-zelandiae]KAI4693386.1 hypothetical protein J4E88_001757 [Alternaria novae-zelandiae]